MKLHRAKLKMNMWVSANWQIFIKKCSCLVDGLFNTLRAGRNGQHFPDDIFKRTCILFSGNVWILIIISLEVLPEGPINNNPGFVQIMAWHRLGDKPLSETIVVWLPTHICVTQPEWVKWNINFIPHIWRIGRYLEWLYVCWNHPAPYKDVVRPVYIHVYILCHQATMN